MPTAKQLANLRPFSKRTKSEPREVGRKGGKKSGESRKQLKTFRELLNKQLANKTINGENIKEVIANKLLKLAQGGNLKAIEMVRDTLGEKPIEKSLIKDRLIKMYQVASIGIDGDAHEFDYEFNSLSVQTTYEITENTEKNVDTTFK